MDPLAIPLDFPARLQQAELLLLAGATLLLFALESLPGCRVRDYGTGRARHFARNVGAWLIGALIVGVAFSTLLVSVAGWLQVHRVGLLFAWPLPLWLLVVVGVLLLDGTDYLYHRLSHEAGWLWRLHALHHSDDRMDVTTNVRAHPLHVLVTLSWRLVVLAALGLPQWIAMLRDVIALPIALWSHSNVRFPEAADRWLRIVLVTPAIHRIHHSPVPAQTDANYGALFSFWDRLFGSYVEPARGQPLRYGLDTAADPANATLAGMLRLPWRLAARAGAGAP